MTASARSILLAAAAFAASALLAGAPASAQGVKIGVLNDQSRTFADFDGKGSIEAAKMAIEDFGGSVLGQKIELARGRDICGSRPGRTHNGRKT